MKPLIKWCGGKSGELSEFVNLIPTFDRYIEPFFGGGALFFDVKPVCAVVNDISINLMDFYALVKEQDLTLYYFIKLYDCGLRDIISIVNDYYDVVLDLYNYLCFSDFSAYDVALLVEHKITSIFNFGYFESLSDLILSCDEFSRIVSTSVADKFKRVAKFCESTTFTYDDLKRNIITGFTSGYYTYFRKIFNDLNLNRIDVPSLPYKIANFYFIKEFCYGAMSRYNKKGEFNVPYGGISYNNKSLVNKLDRIFCGDCKLIFDGTDICNMDFEVFFDYLSFDENDFIFLDPPYDSSFSTYDMYEFGIDKHIVLANILKHTRGKFMLVIKNTDFIYSLYKDHFRISTFHKNYKFNILNMNERGVEHLVVTNYEV